MSEDTEKVFQHVPARTGIIAAQYRNLMDTALWRYERGEAVRLRSPPLKDKMASGVFAQFTVRS